MMLKAWDNDVWLRSIKRPSQIQKMGLEMEFFAYDAKTYNPLGTCEAIHPSELLLRLEKQGHGEVKRDPATQVITGLMLDHGANYSLEPGGQLEFSTAPKATLTEVHSEVLWALKQLEVVANNEVLFLSHGTNPIAPADLPLLVPKQRYQYLSHYFSQEPGGRGIHMSRFTATVQPNLDIAGSQAWDDAVNLTWLLTPFVRHLFANSKYFQGKKTVFPSERQAIWQAMDKTRTGIPENLPFAEDIPSAYGEWAMNAFVFLIDGSDIQPKFGELRFAQWMKQGWYGRFPTVSDWQIHLATLFPDLRLRGFLEVRSLDAQPFEHSLAPLAFFSGILQSGKVRKRTFEFLLGVARSYLNCVSAEEDAGLCSEKRSYLKLLAANPNHPVFTDSKIHQQLISIAKDAWVDRGEDLGVHALERYSDYLAEKCLGETSENALQYVKMNATNHPSDCFDFMSQHREKTSVKFKDRNS